MSAPLMPLLREQFVDGTGAPYAGALIYAYASGSSTPQDTYSDSDLDPSHVNANPVQADADGRFGAIYLDPTKAYKFVIKSLVGATIFTQDEVTTTGTALLSVLTVTTDYTVTVADGEDVMLLVSAALGNVVITLYTAVGNSGRKVRAIKTDTSANTVTITPFGGQTINGAATLVLSRQYDSMAIFSDNTNWLQLYRSLQATVLSKTANYTVATTDGDDVVVLVDATSGAVTVSLYTAVGNASRKVTVVKVDSSANAVTLDPNGSQTWNGSATKTLSSQWDATDGVSDGANWVQFASTAAAVDDAGNILANQVFS